MNERTMNTRSSNRLNQHITADSTDTANQINDFSENIPPRDSVITGQCRIRGSGRVRGWGRGHTIDNINPNDQATLLNIENPTTIAIRRLNNDTDLLDLLEKGKQNVFQKVFLF